MTKLGWPVPQPRFTNQTLAHVGPRARVAILYNPNKDAELPYLGIQIQDIPRAYLAESDKMETGTDDDLSQYLLSRVDDNQFARFLDHDHRHMDTVTGRWKLV